MKIIMAKQEKTSIVWIALLVGIIVSASFLCASFLTAAFKREKTALTLEESYQRAFAELIDNTENMELNLSKLMVGLSKARAMSLVGEIDREAELALSALGQLPVDMNTTFGTVKFFNQASDWCRSYLIAIATGAPLKEFEKQTDVLHDIASRINEGMISVIERINSGEKISALKLSVSMGSSENILKGFDGLQEGSLEYPELVYNGPFSDSKGETCYKGLADLEEISESQAIDRFNKLMGVTSGKIVGHSSSPAAYEIEGDDVYASISVQGGKIINLTLDRKVGKINLSEEEAVKNASEYVEKLGLGKMQAVWYNASDGIAYVNLTPVVDDVIIYTDLVKVKIALDDGRALGIEATGYCKNHCERSFDPKISKETAAKLSGIEHDLIRLCLSPDGETEALCYEVHGSFKGMEYFVFVDAVNGEKIKVLRILGTGDLRHTL